jgi:hypothetical protein
MNCTLIVLFALLSFATAPLLAQTMSPGQTATPANEQKHSGAAVTYSARIASCSAGDGAVGYHTADAASCQIYLASERAR